LVAVFQAIQTAHRTFDGAQCSRCTPDDVRIAWGSQAGLCVRIIEIALPVGISRPGEGVEATADEGGVRWQAPVTLVGFPAEGNQPTGLLPARQAIEHFMKGQEEHILADPQQLSGAQGERADDHHPARRFRAHDLALLRGLGDLLQAAAHGPGLAWIALAKTIPGGFVGGTLAGQQGFDIHRPFSPFGQLVVKPAGILQRAGPGGFTLVDPTMAVGCQVVLAAQFPARHLLQAGQRPQAFQPRRRQSAQVRQQGVGILCTNQVTQVPLQPHLRVR